MLEQWEADRLLAMRKVYSTTVRVDLGIGVNGFYALESDDETESFLLDIFRGRLNPTKARYQLRYQREVVLARLCTSVEHTNPDGERIEPPHLHRYDAEFSDKIAAHVGPFEDITAALNFFCDRINAPRPEVQGGIS